MDADVEASQEHWRRSRRALNRSRVELAVLAAGAYPRELHVDGLPFLAPASWLPAAPIPLDAIRLGWAREPGAAPVTGREPEADAVLPLAGSGRRFPRYTAAMEHLDRPVLFEDRPSYRLLEVDLGADPRLTFAMGTYFEKLDLSEALAHELAQVADRASRAALPLRALVPDPFDLRRRVVPPAIETLTLRRDRATGEATFLLLWRDPARVATTAGVHGLVPAGEFQPSTAAPHDRDNDFDLWRCIVREYAEEVCGAPERDGSTGAPLLYDDWPLYRDLERARADGAVRPYCLGVGLDALTLTATVLTVVVIDDDVFDALFGDAAAASAEGALVHGVTGLPFDDAHVDRFGTDEPMSSPGACTLRRARAFRDVLLAGR